MTLTDAEKFIAGNDPRPTGSATNSSYKFYAVKRGKVPGIYTDWVTAQGQIKGWAKPVYKCFSTKAEAQSFLDGGDINPTANEGLGLDEQENISQYYEEGVEPSTKKAKVGDAYGTQIPAGLDSTDFTLDYEPGLGLPPGIEDGFDTNIILSKSGEVVFKSPGQMETTKLRATGPIVEHPLRIYTDGSSLRNGQVGAFAGVGVYFGPQDSR